MESASKVKAPRKVAWIGLGTMGAPMAKNLATSGTLVHGVDRSSRAVESAEGEGITASTSIEDAVQDADAVVTVLPAAAQVREVYSKVKDILRDESHATLMVDCSTVDIQTSQWCHNVVSSLEADFVDAPISGGIAKARAGKLTLMMGGRTTGIERATKLFRPVAENFISAGGPTCGLAAKLCNNLIFYINMIAAAEGLKLAESFGLDLRTFRDIAIKSSGRSFPLESWSPAPGTVEDGSPADHNYKPVWSAMGGLKDIRIILEEAEDHGLELSGAQLFSNQMKQLIEEGKGDLDFSYLISLIGSQPTSGLK